MFHRNILKYRKVDNEGKEKDIIGKYKLKESQRNNHNVRCKWIQGQKYKYYIKLKEYK